MRTVMKRDALRAAAKLARAQDFRDAVLGVTAWSLDAKRDIRASRERVEGTARNWLDTHKPDSWYQFCTMTQAKYELRGEPVAAMIYWSMRFWDQSEQHVEAPEWWQATCEYWDYKASWMENRT